ncbi:hypothetical protein STRMA_1554 [Streptococcus macacae NCTC 11558]|uniref:Uncharacterized protein n=1 Tax=Streptococcus macacae NCTC 11558 TaxID=764298 RepID=G5JX11_9STRE|nr:hypothetical protein STRMA_1554 [Streptococcus macacae NCTC 11558]
MIPFHSIFFKLILFYFTIKIAGQTAEILSAAVCSLSNAHHTKYSHINSSSIQPHLLKMKKFIDFS